MFDDQQIVKVRWNTTNKQWYTDKGYAFTKFNYELSVLAKDLTPKSNAKVIVICDYCGKQFTTKYSSLVNGKKNCQKDCCAECIGKKTSEASRKANAHKTLERAREICSESGYVLLTKDDDYTGQKMTVNFICPKHGIQNMILDNILHGHKCFYCSYEARAKDKQLDSTYVKRVIESTNGNKLLNADEYTGSLDRNLMIRCSCGNIFTTSFTNYVRANVNRCYKCSLKESSGESIVANYLYSRNIAFEREKRFPLCKDKKTLPFDFYLPYYNTVIEFDGAQHYQPVFGQNSFESTVKHDTIKNDYCKNNNIKIIRIPYWNGGEIDSILDENLINR